MNETQNPKKMFCISLTSRNDVFGFTTSELVSSVTKTRLNFENYDEALDYAKAFAKWSGYTFIDIMKEAQDDGNTYVQVDYKS